MIDEERIILMTRMASYEESEGKKNIAIGNYFRSDYLSLQVLKAVLCGSLAYFMLVGAYVMYHFEELMSDIYRMDLMGIGKKLLTMYLIGVGVYALLAYIVCAWKYHNARKNLKRYYNNLRKLNALYKAR
ncbi:MAG: hypothetical protein K6A92_07620 [Lachnospiraceae bacterium]|nr:hypothetical protein [Lachnospiraceae bacterium]